MARASDALDVLDDYFSGKICQNGICTESERKSLQAAIQQILEQEERENSEDSKEQNKEDGNDVDSNLAQDSDNDDHNSQSSGNSSGGGGSEIGNQVLPLLLGLFGNGGLGGGGGGLFGGGGGGGNSWGGKYGGTSTDAKYGKNIDYAQKYLENECECEEVPDFFKNQPDQTVLGPGDKLITAFGPGGQFSDGAWNKIGEASGAQYSSVDKGKAGTQQLMDAAFAAGAGDQLNPFTGERQKVVIAFDCHGGNDYLQGTGGGLTGKGLGASILKGGESTGNTDFSHITIVDGGCMPCRGKNLEKMFDKPGMESVHYTSGAAPNNYAWTSGGASQISQQILHWYNENGITGQPTPLTLGGVKQASQWVGNGAYSYRRIYDF